MKKFICIFLALFLICCAFWGCKAAAEDSGAVYNGYYNYGGAVAEDAVIDAELAYGETFSASTSESKPSVADNRKLIRTLSLSVETENYDELMAQLQQRVSLIGGYIENMEASTRYSSSSRYANMTIRVPADKLDEFAGQVSEISNVVYRTESNRDITTSYVDTQSRRDALATEQDRLLELLEQAGSLDEILQIESRLTEVRYELQSIESQLRTYDNQIDYATISLDVQEVKIYTDTEEKGFWEELGEGFVDSMKGVWNVIKSVFSFLIIALPYLLLVGVVGLAVLIPILLSGKKRRARRKSSSEETQ